jgi:hypothetical protein
MPPAGRTIRLASTVVLVLGSIGIAVAFHRRTPPTTTPAPPAKPSAVVDTRGHCDTIAARYRRALRPFQACNADDDCLAEPRAKFFSGLDRCARFRRKDATPETLADVDALEKAWLGRGCSSLYLTCREERAQCKQGICAELPPEPLPRTYRRVWSGNAFSFFVPPDLAEDNVEGEDSVVGAFTGPKMRLSYDYGRYSNPLESENDDGGPPMDRILSRKEVTLSGRPAVLVTMEELLMQPTPYFLSGVHFPKVPVAFPSLSLGGGDEAKLTMTATCDAPADCASAEGIFRSIEFH